jgi:hypothetical protein
MYRVNSHSTPYRTPFGCDAWNDRAKENSSIHEDEVHQWQALDIISGFWSDQRMETNPLLKQLPVRKIASDVNANANADIGDAE